jgi:hypothetical protein
MYILLTCGYFLSGVAVFDELNGGLTAVCKVDVTTGTITTLAHSTQSTLAATSYVHAAADGKALYFTRGLHASGSESPLYKYDPATNTTTSFAIIL